MLIPKKFDDDESSHASTFSLPNIELESKQQLLPSVGRKRCLFQEDRNRYYESNYTLCMDDTDKDDNNDKDLNQATVWQQQPFVLWYTDRELQEFQQDHATLCGSATRAHFHSKEPQKIDVPHWVPGWSDTLSHVYDSDGLTTRSLHAKLVHALQQQQQQDGSKFTTLVGLERLFLHPTLQQDAALRKRALTSAIPRIYPQEQAHAQPHQRQTCETPDLAELTRREQQGFFLSRRLSRKSIQFAHEIALALADSLAVRR